MSSTQPKFTQSNITGPHHASAQVTGDDKEPDLDLDSIPFAQKWNVGWHERNTLKGRVVVGSHVPSRAGVDELYAKLTEASYPGPEPPYDAFWGARYVIIEDPDGIAVGLMSPVSPRLRSQRPSI